MQPSFLLSRLSVLLIAGGFCGGLGGCVQSGPPGSLALHVDRILAGLAGRPLTVTAAPASEAGRPAPQPPEKARADGPADPAETEHGAAPQPGGASSSGGPAPAGRADNAPLDSFGATVTRDVKAAPRELWQDSKSVATWPNMAVLLVGGAASAMSRWVDADQSLDTTVAKHFEKHHSMPRDWNMTFGALGNPGTHFAMAGVAYLYGALAKDTKTYNVSKTLFSALIINDLATLALKGAVLDDRGPNGEHFAWPSGHTSSAFTTAAVLEVSYGWKAGVPAYAVAAFCGLERMDDREHWLSDVIFGATLGVVVGRSVAKGRLPKIGGWSVLPYSDGRGGGLVLMKQQ